MTKQLLCRICNKNFEIGRLMIHIKSKHNIEPKEYYDMYYKIDNIKCPYCNNDRKFISIYYGYGLTCGNRSCASKLANKKGKEKHKKSCIERNKKWKSQIDYESGLTLQQLIIKKGNIKRNIIRKETSKKQSESMKNGGNEKLKETMKKRYGVSNPMYIKEVKEKVHDKNRQKFTQTLDKMKKTMMERYGVDNAATIETVKKYKIQKAKQKHKTVILQYFKENDLEIISGLDEYINEGSCLKFKCLKCNNKYEKNWNSVQQYFNCKVCNPMNSTSKQEKEIFLFLSENKIQFKHEVNDLIKNPDTNRPYNVDFYLPNHNLVIEFDGLYWHSNIHKSDNNYHLKKTKLCEDKNLQLIHIFEDEWYYKKQIVLSRLKNIMGIQKGIKVIYGRKCNIKIIDSKTKNNFLDNNHIQGKDRSSINIGLFYNDELISVMTFSKGNISKGSKYKKGVWELNRFCSKINTRVIGGLSKLLKYFKNNYEWDKIYSYADRRWTSILSNSYSKNGFKLIGNTNPNYFYMKLNKSIERYHRYNFAKHKLINMNSYDKMLTEQEIMIKEGYVYIYDCGHIKFELTRI